MLNYLKYDIILSNYSNWGESMGKNINKFELLRDKKIISILDGDTNFGEFEPEDGSDTIKISMPYLNGSKLCEISNTFGLPATYARNGGAQSRWKYLDDLLIHCVENNKVSDLLGFLFSKGQFVDKLNGHSAETIDNAFTQIINTIIEQINGVLYFGGNELVRIGKHFLVRSINSSISVEALAINGIDREYIKSISERAMQDVINGNYDSAITKSRTLLEEVFCHVIERKNVEPSDSGDIKKLYNQVKQLYNMHQDKNVDKRINMLLSGLEKILSAIAEMRNEGSDSHGVGARRINISEHHTRLFVNSAMIMGDFILEVGNRNV